jgi:flagellar basal body-associated protein FliL
MADNENEDLADAVSDAVAGGGGADDAKKADEAPSKTAGKLPLIALMAVVVIAAGAAGFVASAGLGRASAPAAERETEDATTALPAEGPAEPDKKAGAPVYVFVPFGEAVANLADERLTRYLRVSFSLKILKENQEKAGPAIEAHKPELMNWLLGHLADKTCTEVAGRAGIDNLRREILAAFNRILGRPWVEDVLFEAFNVQ